MRLTKFIKKVYYFGNKRWCPICNKKSRKFGPFGLKKRPDVQCIHCNSLERHRLFWFFLQQKTDFFKPQTNRKMLHIAPEKCFENQFRSLLGQKYITADLNNPHVQVKMDVTDIPFDDRSFDIIYCSHVLEHVPDDRKAIREFHRVLKDDGWMIILVPINVEKTFEDPSVTDPKEREKLFGQYDHVRQYGPDFVDRIKEAGFHVEKFRARDFLTEETINYCKAFGSPIFYCTKRPHDKSEEEN